VNVQKIQNNVEIQDLVRAIGLEFGKKYKDTSSLRYGKIVLTTDADLDGIHIKGLLINFFAYFWPELLKIGFIYEFITPILKAKKGNKEHSFYTNADYQKWKSKSPVGWIIKYYKGLGTSSPKEARDYFKDLKNHLIPIKWDSDDNSEYIDMIFNKKRANDRKDWLGTNKPVDVIKYKTPTKVSSFFKNEFYHYSMADNVRSIPDIYDGLKPSQRKILHTMLEKNITKSTSVDSISGQVKSFTKYHHGPDSLDKGLIGLSNDFVGSNNIPLTLGSGQFGSRLLGGQDHSAPRYLEASIPEYTKSIIMSEDKGILNLLEEDGHLIEPENFKPIIPIVLVNGADGIGTGYSTSIPKYNILDIIRLIENKINKKNSRLIHPSYNGFKGDIEKNNERSYITRGKFTRVSSRKIHISELPVGKWTNSFIEDLKDMIDKDEIRDFNDNSSEVNVDITVVGNFDKKSDEEIIKYFGLESYLHLSNMILFNDGVIQKFDNIEDIIDVFYKKRLKDYSERKKLKLFNIQKEIDTLTNKAKFIKFVIEGKIEINNKKKSMIEKSIKDSKIKEVDNSYDYLLRMPIYSLTKEKYDELMSKLKEAESNHKVLKKTKPEQIWLSDLSDLKKVIPADLKAK
jgi:DNA topoisomerase-2